MESRGRKAPRRSDTKSHNSWEKGRAGTYRKDGSFMPYVDEHGDPIGVKTFGEEYRRKFQDAGAYHGESTGGEEVND